MANPTTTYDINQLLKDAFGVVGFRSFDPSPGLPYLLLKYDQTELEVTEQKATSMLGTPIIMPVVFDKYKYSRIEKGVKKIYDQDAFTFPPATMIDFAQDSIIEKTRIQGRNGTVKELIALDDWSVRIRGVMVNEGDPEAAPEAEIKKLIQIRNSCASIPILNKMCEWLGVKNVVIEHIDFPALEGYPGTQPFVLECCSDDEFILKYKAGL